MSLKEQERYQSPFSTRYAGEEMQRLFSQAHRARLWRRLWLILAECERELGFDITDAQLAQMREHLKDLDFDLIAGYERETRHDVMAHLKAYALAAPLAAPIIHLGATSCFVGDNADILVMRDAMALVRSGLYALALSLYDFADRYKALPVLGYTHFQPAQPTTLGKRAALWLQDVLCDLLEADRWITSLRPLGSKGTTGTQASFLALFSGDVEKAMQLDQMVAERMGFDRPVPVSGQTYSRKTDSRALQVLSGVAQSAHKFANDIRLLQHLKEVEEPFEAGQVGSSAMPYKRNPMRCERVTGLARFLITNALNADMTAAEQWLERTLDDSANRRIAIAEGFLAADGILSLWRSIASGLVVYPKMIYRHLMEELPFMASENILMRAVLHGGDRQLLHERLRVHAQAAGDRVKRGGEKNDLLERVAKDPAFHLDMEQLKQTLQPEHYTGCAQRQTESYLRGEARDILDRFSGLSILPAKADI